MTTSLRWVAGARTPRKVYITRVWNFGTWQEWQQLWNDYSPTEIDEAVHQPLRGQWTRRGKAFAETLCQFTMPDDVLISYDA